MTGRHALVVPDPCIDGRRGARVVISDNLFMFQVLDVIDCTGSGDVDMGTVVRADAEGFIESYSGRKLKSNPSWVNPSGMSTSKLGLDWAAQPVVRLMWLLAQWLRPDLSPS